MSSVKRVYVEKKADFAVQAKELQHEIESYLGIKDVTGVRVLIRYDVENISDEVFEKACACVFSEPPVDDLFKETFECKEGDRVFSVEYLPGQFDQRADSAVAVRKVLKRGRGADYPLRNHLCDRRKHYRRRAGSYQKASASTRWIPEKQRLKKPETLVTDI